MNRFLFILALLVFVLVPSAARAQIPTSDIAQEPLIPLDSVFGDLHGYLTLHTPDALHLFVRTSIKDWLAEQQRLSEAGFAASQRELLRKTLAMSTNDGVVHYTPITSVVAEATARRDTVSYLPLPVKRDTAQKEILPGVLAQYADLGIAVHGDGQLGGAWRAYKPCDVALTLQCKAGVVPQLTPDMTFGVRVAGTVAERIHVNVNFDQKNEFDATNNLNVSYQGLPDEVFQSLDVGDVSIRLPTSRYLTRGIPAGNFGLRATGQVGPLDFQTVYAQQKGDLGKRSFEVAGAGSTQSVVQQQHLVTDDADYVQGQFFYLVDPTLIRGAPYFDPLALRASDAPVSVRPRTGGVIALYRDERLSATSGVGNAELGRFLANAVPATGPDQHSGTFRRLTPDVDYVVHSSGLWITLKSPLRTDEALAMAYVTESGDTIGDINAEQSPAGTTPLLRLLRGPVSKHQPGSATWNYEMHDVYRLDNSAGVDLSSIDMKISLGDVAGGKTFQTVNGTQVTYMKFFGLDEDAPTDRVDEAQIYQPSRGAFGSATTVTVPGTFVVLPGLQPFLDPAPVPSANLSSEDLKAALGPNANNTIYNEVDPVNRANGARFKLNFDYRVQADGLVSSFALGAIGIRDGSERIMLGTQQLQKGADYDIDYDVGQLTLRDPTTLFATHPGAKLTATWEQKPMFEIAPTSVFGMNTRYTIGHRGQLDFVGLLQNERSLMARPQLGTEPGAVFLGGMSGGLDLGGRLLDQVFSKVPWLRLGSSSRAHLTAEVAMSSPNPNTKGAAYLEDFEATDELRIDPRRQNWSLGSKPETNTGDLGTLPFVLNATNAAPLIWTHDYKTENGNVGGSFTPDAFDDSIIVAGNKTPEYTMRLDFGKSGVVGKQQWRSITTVLSTTGMDLSHSEYMEMYVAAGDKEPLALIFDLGNVSEDAFYVDSLGNTTGNYPDGTQTKWGIGTLDEEARLAQREVWGTGPGSPDARGLWNQNCSASPGEVYIVGDPRTNCTRNNGVRNTEDLDGNGVLDAHDGAYFRYVITLDQLSQYLVRSKEQTGTSYQLYRIPLRNGSPIGGANESTWRFIKQLRLTVAGTPTLSGIRTVQIARMRIVGSQWIKRDSTGSSSGVLSDQPGRGAIVHVSPISRLTDAQYSTPGNVNVAVQDPSKTIGSSGVENNEKSLSISYDRLLPGDRAEVYYRYPQQARSFMNYRTLRLWALPRAGTWGVPGGERFLVKVGTDARNFYLFQTTLRPAGPSASNWLPELEIDFSKWFALKDSAEKQLIEHPPTAGGQDTVWSADSAYAIVLEDRARAPNLDQIRELSFAVYNAGSGSATGEVWIDDVTLTGAERSIGRAAALTLDMNVGDFINGSVSLSHQDDVFRQLNENATYIAAGDVAFNATAQLDRLLPASLGIYLPVTVTHTGSGQDPTFLASTDVLAQGLGSLRETGAGNTTVAVVLSKRTPTANPFLSAIIDGTSLRFNYASASNRQITSKAETGSLNAGLSYNHPIMKKSFDVVPMFMENFLRAIVPVRVEHSDAFKRLVNSHLRFLPDGISFNTGYSNQIARTFNYDRILTLPEDSLIRPIESPRQGLQNDARLSLAPFNGLTASIAAGSVRDLLDPTRATQDPRVQAALQKARGGIGGLDLGWETNRNIRSNFSYSPQISTWITADYNYENVYTTDRSPSYLGSFQDDSSSNSLALQRRFESGRTTTRRVRLRPGDFALAAFGAAPKKPVGFDRIRRGVLNRFDVIEFTWNTTLSSQFERENQLPDLAYQIGLGNLSSFHVVNNDTAARALLTNEFRTTAGIPVSKVTRVDLSYGTTNLHSLDLRGGERLQNERSWPRVQVNMHDIPLPEKWHKLLVNATVTGGVSRVVTTNVFGGTSAQDRSTTKFDIPVSTTLTFAHGVSMNYTGTFSTGKSLDPTGRRETVNGSQQLRFNSFFGAPTFVSSKFTQPLATSLTLTQRSSTQCGASALLLVTDCTRQINTVIRTGRFEASTNVDQMRVGVSLDYNGTQNYVGIQNGQSQLQFSIFGSFLLNAGTMPSEFGGIH